MLLLTDRDSLELKGYTVIVPSICVGNAAQLAVDLLISSKQLKRIGNIVHPALIPVFGPSAYQHEANEKVSACELYEGKEDQLLVVQFRTPLISKYAANFHKFLADMLKESKRVVILSGSFGFEKRIIGGSPYEYRASDLFKEAHKTELASIQWNEFAGDVIYGGGNSMQLYKTLENLGVPVMLLFRYLLEGDNSTDAAMILRELNELCEGFLQIQDNELKLTIPISWKLLFGNEVTEVIF